MHRFYLQRMPLPGLLLAALLLRVWAPGQMAVEHFDEGVYASNLFSDQIGFRYPDREFYAPPLLPAILEWVLILTGGNPHAVMWVNAILGTGLVAAVYWTTRQLLSGTSPPSEERSGLSLECEIVTSQAPLAAASLVAFSDLFIQYSRAALTDIPVCLGMTLAVGAGARGLIRRSWSWSIASGVLTAIAWWTKYNGWLPLAILGGGCGGWWLLTPAGRESFQRPAAEKETKQRQKKRGTSPAGPGISPGVRQLLQWSLTACLAGLLWLPCLAGLQQEGGYAAVAGNHRGYLVGFGGWMAAVQQHLAVDRFYSKESSVVGLLLLLMVFFIPSRRSLWWLLFLLLPALPWIGLIPVLSLLSALSIGMAITLLTDTRKRFGPPLGLWILLSWITGLTLTTPLYRPYPRLILPLLISLCIASGVGLSLLRRRSGMGSSSVLSPEPGNTTSPGSPSQTGLSTNSAWLACVTVLATAILLTTKPVSRSARTGLKTGAIAVVDAIQEDLLHHPSSEVPELDAVIYVVAEPGLYYHLAAREDERLHYITQPASDLGMLTSGKIDQRVPAYLVTGPHADKELAELTRSFEPNGQVRRISEIPYAPSPLVLLDEFSPTELPEHRQAPLHLWAIQQK